MASFWCADDLEAPGLKNIIDWGNRTNEYVRSTRQVSKRVQQKQR